MTAAILGEAAWMILYGDSKLPGSIHIPVVIIQSLQVYNYNYYLTYPTVFWSTGPMFLNTVLKGLLVSQTDRTVGDKH